jgi:hypothetical protein
MESQKPIFNTSLLELYIKGKIKSNNGVRIIKKIKE